MNRSVQIVVGGLASMACLWLAYRTVDGAYLSPRSELAAKNASLQEQILEYEQSIQNHPQVLADLQSMADRSLGSDRETVDHRLRSRLNRLAEEVGLQRVTVGTGNRKPMLSPARSTFRGSARRSLRDEIDFVELPGWVSCSATLEQAVQLIDRIETEPWLKQLIEIKFDSRDNGERFDVTIRLATLYLPGWQPDSSAPVASSPQRYAQFASLIEANPFRLPPPNPEAGPTETIAMESLPGVGGWSVTGIATGPQGAEVWLFNNETWESNTLRIGDQFHGSVLVAAHGDRVEFEDGDRRFVIEVGQRIHDGLSMP